MNEPVTLADVFTPNFIELLKLVPTNPYVRGLILKFTGKLPPEDCVTFEALAAWVTQHCSRRIRKPVPGSRPAETGISIRVKFSEVEYGRANYSVDRSGESTFDLAADDLHEIIDDAIATGGGMTEVLDTILLRVEEDAWNQCDPSLEDYGEYDYNDHDCTDSDNGSVRCSREAVRNLVLAFVRQRLPDRAEQLTQEGI
jgi:hypothetical protein